MWIFLLFTLASAQSLEQVYHLRHGCSEEHCMGTTTCMGKCISYLQGEPCDISTSDIELYMDMYYLKKVNVRTTCWESFVTYYIDVLGESEGMTTEEYDRRSQDSLHRVDIVDGKWYGYGRKVEDKIKIWSNLNIVRSEPCDTPCEYTHDMNGADAYVYERRGYVPTNQSPSVYMQMEGEHYYPIKLDGYEVENTYRWSSPILKPYYELIHYKGEKNILNKPEGHINGMTFLARNCHSKNGREELVRQLQSRGIRIDSMSSCLHNTAKPSHDNKIEIMKPYKFHAAFENGNVIDYVTEKVYLALAAGTLPVYLGAPNIQDFVPEGSIIDASQFTFDSLAQHLKECMQNKTLYSSYFAWKNEPNSAFFDRFAFTNVSTECRTCRYFYAKKHGVQWDHKYQQLSI